MAIHYDIMMSQGSEKGHFEGIDNNTFFWSEPLLSTNMLKALGLLHSNWPKQSAQH